MIVEYPSHVVVTCDSDGCNNTGPAGENRARAVDRAIRAGFAIVQDRDGRLVAECAWCRRAA